MNDDQLRRLLSDAVSDVEPEDRLDQIRASVRPDPKVVPMARSRSWTYAAAGIVATAAVIGVVAYATGAVPGMSNADTNSPTSGRGHHHPGPVSSSPTPTPTSSPSPTHTTPTVPPPQWRAAATYYLGNGPHGPVLFREFSSAPPTTRPLDFAVSALESIPRDPDYRTAWQAGWLVGARMDHGVVDVEVAAPAARPSTMTPRTATEAIQQVIYTVQAAVGSRAHVQFTRSGTPASTVLGVPTARPLKQGLATKVLSLMNITEPTEAVPTNRGPLVVTGVNNGFEASVLVKLERGGKVYLQKAGLASGTGAPDKLFPWKVVLNTSKLAPGQYTLIASNDDPSGQGHPSTDTRTVILK